MTTEEPSIEQCIDYINREIDTLTTDEKKGVLQKIIYNIPDNKIENKGAGTQIRYKDMPDTLIRQIYKYVFEIINKRLQAMQ